MIFILSQRRPPKLTVLHLKIGTRISLLHVSSKITNMIWMNNREPGTIPPDFPSQLVIDSFPHFSLPYLFIAQ